MPRYFDNDDEILKSWMKYINIGQYIYCEQLFSAPNWLFSALTLTLACAAQKYQIFGVKKFEVLFHL
jgi:hypothetical protein